jgi:PAS domain S-box-containing protein
MSDSIGNSPTPPQPKTAPRDQSSHDFERFLTSIVENIPVMVFVKDAATLRFVLLNKAEEELLGMSRDHVLGRSDYDLFPKEEADFFTSIDRGVIANGKLLDIPEEPLQTDRGVLYLHTKKIPLRDDDGKPKYLLGISEDITERKRAEEELRRKNQMLEESVHSERQALETLKLAQSRLVQAEKLASLGQLVAGVAHEINNPLAFVGNNTAVVQRDLAGLLEIFKLYQSLDPMIAGAAPEVARQISQLSERLDLDYVIANLTDTLVRSREGLKRIQQIVLDLRDFSRQEAVGKMQDGVDLNPGILSTINIVRGRAKTRGVELASDLSPLPGITCSPAKINQVILNLIANAVDACKPGCKVTVRSRSTPPWAEIEIEDTGSGIDPAIRDKIFDPFFTTKPQGQGTGLGLSISHGIIAEHGGTIGVESMVGEGTKFVIRLPIASKSPIK